MSSEYFVIGTVTARGISIPLQSKVRICGQELNLLGMLCEHVNRVIGTEEICYRLKISENTLRVMSCRLRKKLHYDWTIDAVTNKGFRILYIANSMNEAERTYLEINPIATQRFHPKRRKHISHAV